MNVRQALKYCTPPIVVDAARRAIKGPPPPPKRLDVDKDETIHGTLLRFPHYHYLPWTVQSFPHYDLMPSEICKFLLAEKGVPISVIDVGANVGDTAAIIANAVGPQNVEFICVEADEKYIPYFHHNTASLNLKLVHALAGAQSGTVKLSPIGEFGTSSFVSSDEERKTVALDDLVESVDLLKIDTDGYEIEVLKGATRLLKQPSLTLFTEFSPQHIRHYGKTNPRDVLSLIRSAGFDNAIVYDNIGTPIGIFPTTGPMLSELSDYCERRPTPYYLDLLFFRDQRRTERFFGLETERMPKRPPPP